MRRKRTPANTHITYPDVWTWEWFATYPKGNTTLDCEQHQPPNRALETSTVCMLNGTAHFTKDAPLELRTAISSAALEAAGVACAEDRVEYAARLAARAARLAELDEEEAFMDEIGSTAA